LIQREASDFSGVFILAAYCFESTPWLGSNGQPYEVFDLPQGPAKQIFVLQSTEAASTKLPFEKRRAGLGTTHHEAGTLRKGTDPNDSVTNVDGRFHDVANTYVAGPAYFPDRARVVLESPMVPPNLLEFIEEHRRELELWTAERNADPDLV
jgi:hypothetical protein